MSYLEQDALLDTSQCRMMNEAFKIAYHALCSATDIVQRGSRASQVIEGSMNMNASREHIEQQVKIAVDCKVSSTEVREKERTARLRGVGRRTATRLLA